MKAPISSLRSRHIVVFGLAILEEIAQAAGPTLLLDLALRGRVRETIRSFYDSWSELLRRGLHSTLISCAVTGSLFRLAGAIPDMKLYAAFLESSKTLELWDDNSPDAVVTAVIHLAPLVHIIGCEAESVVEALDSFSTDAQLRNVVLSTAVKELIRRDVDLIHTILLLAGK